MCVYTHAHTQTHCVSSKDIKHAVGCLKLQVSFCKRATDYRALLQKISYQDTGYYGSSPSDWDGVAKTHNFPYLYRSFSAKVTYIWSLFCGKWSATWVLATLYQSSVFSYVYTHTRTHTHTHTHTHTFCVMKENIRYEDTGWRRPIGYLIFIGQICKSDVYLVALLWKMICNLSLGHLVSVICVLIYVHTHAHTHTHTHTHMMLTKVPPVLIGNFSNKASWPFRRHQGIHICDTDVHQQVPWDDSLCDDV